MRSLATIYSGPRGVTLAGDVYRVDELRVIELVELQRAVEARWAGPIAAVAPLLAAESVEPADRPRVGEAYAAAVAGPPAWGSRRARERLGPIGEMFVFLAVVLGRHHPEVVDDGEALARIALGLQPGEYTALLDAAYRPEPLDVLGRALDRWAGTAAHEDGDGDDDDDPPDWALWIDRVAQSHGYTYPQIAEMPRTQFLHALVNGKSPEGRAAANFGEAMTIHRKWRAWLAGGDAGADAEVHRG